ncbi:TorF family putative porin [Sphingobium lignivorans]|uniref:Uncharacterized protein (TIGR02001 family) n=1 Tax=Sphingobium lignivorans TaxID=2735886 RepID=A0ABR6NL07_9SPHN|nr:TorF family putative porin [Sphingobium lignivorans]MBB5987962.1 uncharacterized protein (TIGR02001 family) [Sphingobium lignivorans]
MRKSIIGLSAFAILASATPALAQEEASSPVTISGSATLVSDYRFRGFSQSNENIAVQAGIDISHESGFYVGTWGSSIGFAGNAEIDVFGGYTTDVAEGLNVDVGILAYIYPKAGYSDSTIVEPYVTLTGTYGPASLAVGINYAWDQASLASLDTGEKSSAIYVHAEPSITVPNTPLTVDGHIGYAKSNSFLGGYGPDHHVWDYSVGVSGGYGPLTFGVHYVNTDEARQRSYAPGTGAEDLGADGAVIFSVGASF